MQHRLVSAFSIFLILALLLMPVASVSADSGDDINAFSFYYDHLNERQQYLYHWVKSFIDNKEYLNYDDVAGLYKIDVAHLFPDNPTEEDCDAFFADLIYAQLALQADEPQYLMVGVFEGFGCDVQAEEPYFVCDFQRNEIYTENNQARIAARIRQIVDIAGNGDRYMQLRRMVSHLLETSFYDPYLSVINEYAINGEYLAYRGHHYNQSTIGLLLEGVAVCDGFSQSFKLLCNELNIPCIIMGNHGHAWNLVQMDDGKWYRVDLTNACRLGWDAELPLELDEYFEQQFLNNNVFGSYELYRDPYMLALDGVPLVTEFPEHAEQQYRYTGSTTDFSYSVPASTYIPGESKFSYCVNADGKTCTITDYEGEESGDLVIPEILDGYTVNTIGKSAFYYCDGFDGVLIIPDTVEVIDRSAFAGCYNLTSVQFSANLHQIGEGAFIGCKGLTEVTLPNLVNSLGDYAFYDCDGLRTVTFGRHLQSVGVNAFGEVCDALLVGPADSAIQTYAADAGLNFRAEGTMCDWVDPDGQWEYNETHHYHTCEHGGRFDIGRHLCLDENLCLTAENCTACGWSYNPVFVPPAYVAELPDGSAMMFGIVLIVAAVVLGIVVLRKKK